MSGMLMTDKQIEIMKLVIEGNEDGSLCDIDQLCERLSYKPSKESLQFSLRALSKHKMLARGSTEKRRGRRRRLIEPTRQGILVYGRRKEAVSAGDLGEKSPVAEDFSVKSLFESYTCPE